MNTVIPVELERQRYDIIIGTGLLNEIGPLLRQHVAGKHILIVTDQNVGPLYAWSIAEAAEQAGKSVDLAMLPAGEQTKSLRYWSQLLDRLVEAAADRKSAVLALGGGVIGDLAGFTAAAYARGIGFIQVPTTLLAMVDASVGGKVAVDHPRGKNLIGAFHQPAAVVCDLDCLYTLPEREYRCGLAEVVKYGVILDRAFFEYLEQNADAVNRHDPEVVRHMVARSCEIKADVVRQDERETTGLRAALNYGHTFAHAFETAAGYHSLLHGEAVAIGMMCAAELASRLGLLQGDSVNLPGRQRALWERLGLPTTVPRALLNHDLVGLMAHDKKAAGGRPRFILPRALGRVETVDVSDLALVRQVIEDAR